MSVISGDIDKLLHGQPTSMVLVEATRKERRDRIWLESKRLQVLEKKSDGVMSVVVCMRDVSRNVSCSSGRRLTGVDNRRAFDLSNGEERALRTRQPLSLILHGFLQTL